MCTGIRYALFDRMLKQPHLLIAGATGSGKSVVINGLIYNMLFDGPNKYRFILIDPKRVELVKYKALPHTIKYASEPADMHNALLLAMDITENRYRTMQKAGTVKYTGSNVYIIIDEFADLILTDKRVKPLIQRLAQIGRAAAVHIILATQTPIAKVIPTEIKCNFDARVGLRTRSKQDSRNILGFTGLETLPRYGQCIYMDPENTGKYIVPYVDAETLQQHINHWTKPKNKLFAWLHR
jgi:S-DNA-T family DNA segregation ATPase FtsK/SpoIIIE